jgi:feruloyl esterase
LASTGSDPASIRIRWTRLAAISTDTGHTSTEPQLWLENQDLVIDYSYRGLHLTTVNAKAIVAAFYNRAPKFSYYSGCSTGGKQALFEARSRCTISSAGLR